MLPEDMVHALHKTHSLLKPNGVLIHIQPSPMERPVEIHHSSKVEHAGNIGHTLNYAKHKKALDAVNQVVTDKLFALERDESFDFKIHAENFSTMEDYVNEEWTNAILYEDTVKRAYELEKKFGTISEVIVIQEIIIMRLKVARIFSSNPPN